MFVYGGVLTKVGEDDGCEGGDNKGITLFVAELLFVLVSGSVTDLLVCLSIYLQLSNF